MNRLTRFLPLGQFFLAPSMAGAQQTPPCSRCGVSRNGQAPNTELCAACLQAAYIQAPSTPAGSSQDPSTQAPGSSEVPSTQTSSSGNPATPPQLYKASGPWRETRRDSDDESSRASHHTSEDRVWVAEYQKISDQEEAQAARQEKRLRKSIECEQRLSKSLSVSLAPIVVGDSSDRYQREGAPTPSPVHPPPSIVITSVPAPPPPSPRKGQHPPSPVLAPVPASASAPASVGREQEEAILGTPSTRSDIPSDPKDEQHPPAPAVPAAKPEPQRNMKLTPVCARCKRSKIRCKHRQLIDENGNVVAVAASAAPTASSLAPKKRKRDDEPYIPAESQSSDSSAPPPAKRVLRLRPPKPPTNSPEASPPRPKLDPTPKAQGEKRPRGRPRKQKANESEDESECESVKPPPAKRGGKGKTKIKQECTSPPVKEEPATMTGIADGDDIEFDVAMRRKLQMKLVVCRKNLQATLDAVREAEQILQEWFDARGE